MTDGGQSNFLSGPGKCYAFIDADNAWQNFQQSMTRHGLSSEELEFFSFETIIRTVPASRRYLFGAAEDGKAPQDWLVRLRAENTFIFRQGKLIVKPRGKKQQGVDVMLAVEALRSAYAKNMDSCIVFTDDGDLLPLVSALVDLGIHTSVFGFGNPSQSSVAASFQDTCDMYIQIGSNLLHTSLKQEYRATMSGNTNKAMFLEFGQLFDIPGFEQTLTFAKGADRSFYVCNTQLSDLNEYANAYYCRFPNYDAAMAKYKLTKNFFV